jgi:hypothetical protein
MSNGHYRPGGRISKADARRRLAAAQASSNEVRIPSADDVILATNATSDLAVPLAESVRPFIATVLAHSSLNGTESKRKHATHLKYLALYAIERGLSLVIETVMTTTVIDAYIRQLAASDNLRAQRRTRLLNLATHVNSGPATPAKLTPIGHIAIKPPYTPAEAVVIRRVTLEQPTAQRARKLAAVVGVCAGAGGNSPDLRHLYHAHVWEGDPGIHIEFQDPNPRHVVCRAFWEPVLRRAMTGGRPNQLFYGEQEDRRNLGARAIDNAELLDGPRIEVARLRATWLADLMTDPVPLAVILKASGLKTARTLAEVMPHLDGWLDHKGLTNAQTDLRGQP